MARIVFITPGSRGDIQPYVALGKGLQEAGHFVRVVTHKSYENLVKAHGLEFWSLEANIEEIIQNDKMREVLENGSLVASMAQMAKEMERSAIRLAERSLQACADVNLIMAGVGGLFVALSIAEKTGLPFLQAYNVPITPTREFPGVLLPSLPTSLGGSFNRITHYLTQQMIWQAYRPSDRAVRQKVFGLPPTSLWGPYRTGYLREAPILYGFSPSVICPPADWDARRIHVTGYWNLEPSENWNPPEALARFIEAGPPPVYIGFGSMSNRKPEETAELVFEALKQSSQRGIVFSGWAGLRKEALPDTVLMIDSTPHSWLFPRMRAVVHHGGAGTTAAGLRAGVPSVVVPYHGDQPFWGSRVTALRAGPQPIPRRKMTANRLAQAIEQAIYDQTLRLRAAELGRKIRAENGISAAVEFVSEFIARNSKN